MPVEVPLAKPPRPSASSHSRACTALESIEFMRRLVATRAVSLRGTPRFTSSNQTPYRISLRALGWLGLTEEDELAQKIDQDRVLDVVVPTHDLFVHRHDQERITRPESVLGLQHAIIERINLGRGRIGPPLLPLRADV